SESPLLTVFPMPRALRTLSLFIALLGPGSVAAAERSILVFGDSLSAAYGIAQARGWVALLAQRVAKEHPEYSVANASVSGETTAGGLARFAGALARHKPAVVVLELGANDGLRGLPVAQMKSNLAAMIERAQRSNARVVLLGMKLPPNYGPDYTQAFGSAYGELAGRYKTAFVPFFLEGFAQKPEMFQPDGIHPTEAAQPQMADAVWRALQPLLRRR
ncbi:MAG TPA: arylesterase, partial [Burkholderiales bacterium]|nr:arylesterase [Burkholderiales bacterium]